MKRVIFTVGVFLFSLTSLTQAYSGGNGTSEDPYQITTTQDLIDLGNDPCDYDKSFVLTADIDLNNQVWYDTFIDEFRGALDGDGHTIKNLTVFGGSITGLIGTLTTDAKVCNLGFENARVLGQYTAGIIVDNNGLVSNCYSTGKIAGWISVGGLVGENRGGTIIDCHSSAVVEGTHYVGGLAGGSSGDVIRCHGEGTVRGAMEGKGEFPPKKGSGGLLGSNSGSVIDCFSAAGVWGDHDVGGLLGENHHGSVIRSYSTGDVTGEWQIGGLVGGSYEGKIAQSYSKSKVTGDWFVGGLVGWNRRSSTILHCYSTGKIQGKYDAGGLVGTNSDGYVSTSFWDVESSGYNESDGGTGLSHDQMMHIDNYLQAGWDFASERKNGLQQTWSMPSTGGYPVISIMHGYIPPILKGEGTEILPYQVSSSNDLGALTYYNSHAHYELTDSIALAGTTWAHPILLRLSGSLNGNGNTINDLTMRGHSNLGLIGTLEEGAVVHNLGIVDANIICTGEKVGLLISESRGSIDQCFTTGKVIGDQHVGGIVGSSVQGKIKRCYNAAEVIARNYSGGLAGKITNSTEIALCYNNGRVTGERYAGGITAYNASSKMKHCYSTGRISAGEYGGGLVGLSSSGEVSACLWDMESSNQNASSGGIALSTEEMMNPEYLGLNGWGNIEDWILDPGNDYPRLTWEATLGQIIPLPTINWMEGEGTIVSPYELISADQLVKINRASTLWDKVFKLEENIDLGNTAWSQSVFPEFEGNLNGNNLTISNLTIYGRGNLGFVGSLHSVAEIRNLSVVDANIRGSADHVGILVGRNEGSISNTYGSGLSQGRNKVGGLVGQNYRGSISSSSSSCIVNGDNDVGGLIGENISSNTTQCNSTSNVNGGNRVGGLVGINNTSIVSNCQTASSVSGNNETGGLAGHNAGLILNSYAFGPVDGNENVGGLVGQQTSFPTELTVGSFWDIELTATTTSASGEGKTSAELMDFSLYEGYGWSISWDDDNMNTLWHLPTKGGPPFLDWEADANQPQFPTFSGGSGTLEDPYLLATALDLQQISGAPLLLDKHYRLVQNIDLAGVTLRMIGREGLPFKGSLEGSGYTFTNLTIISDNDLVGLFSMIGQGALVTNLFLDNIIVSGRNYVGGLAGQNNGTVTHCNVTGQVSGNFAVGGLIGWNWATVENSQTKVDVTGNDYTGPLVGLDRKPFKSSGGRGR